MADVPPPIPSNQTISPNVIEIHDPSKHDEIVNDILKHLTTLNTGLLAILSAFTDQVSDLLKSNQIFATYFLYAFYMSLLACMIGFVLTVLSPHIKDQRRHVNIKILRDVVVTFAAFGYIGALVIFFTIYSAWLNLFS